MTAKPLLTLLTLLTPLTLLSSACDSSPAGDESQEAETGTEAEASPYDCVDPEFTEFRPLVGPGYNPEDGLVGELQSSYVVHTTQVLVPPEHIEEFIALIQVVGAELEQTEGLIAYALAGETTCGFQRTLGIWRDTESMYNFVFSKAHADAMAKTLDVSITGKVTHWDATPDELPATWEQAMAKLAEVAPSGVY